jgi:hypothetical protein
VFPTDRRTQRIWFYQLGFSISWRLKGVSNGLKNPADWASSVGFFHQLAIKKIFPTD